MPSYTLSSMVRGYHVYQSIWNAVEGETLNCVRETVNQHDPYAVAVVKDGATVGHVPRMISALCSLFIRRGGTISCTVDGTRRYSRDLPQGGMEIPCLLTFTAEEQSLIDKISNHIRHVEKVVCCTPQEDKSEEQAKEESQDCSPQPKVIRLDLSHSDDDQAGLLNWDDEEWVRLDARNVLKISEKEVVLRKKLDDRVINCAQIILQRQFPSLTGFYSSLLLPTLPSLGEWQENFIQICHCRGDHWITVSTRGCKAGELIVYDSLYMDVDALTAAMFRRLFDTPLTYIMAGVQKQEGVVDCGAFAIANATAIAFSDTESPIPPKFDQNKLRTHLASCFETKCFSAFPYEQ